MAHQADRGRLALVTGANRGIGFETCRQLLAAGLRVVLAGRDEDALDRARRTLDASGARTAAVRMDVTDAASIRAARRLVIDRLGTVQVLVNNAAILVFESGDVLSLPAEAYQRTFDTNVFGAIDVCRAFVPDMAEAGYGRVVNVSSGAGQLARMTTYAPAYSMSKSTLNAFTRLLAATTRSRTWTN